MRRSLHAMAALMWTMGAMNGQALSVSGGSTLNVGQVVTITYTGGTPGATITIDMDNAGPKTDSVQITLDSEGNGSATWTVPTWAAVNFNAPGVDEISRTINP